ncbi:MAG: hypothetical protein ACRCZK_01095 [Oscillospiraceae bacterium]
MKDLALDEVLKGVNLDGFKVEEGRSNRQVHSRKAVGGYG